jgi:hypothetical protein
MKDRKRPQKKEGTSGKQQRTIGSHPNGANNHTKSDIDALNSEESDRSNDDVDDDEDDGDDDMARTLFIYADGLISSFLHIRDKETELLKALKALEKCKFLLLHSNPVLQKMLRKASTRDMSDKKVPPGSASVQRTIQDDRFILSLACIGCSKVQAIIIGDVTAAVRSLREALVSFPRSAEANESLAQLLRMQGDSQDKLDLVESLLKKAMVCRDQLKDATATATINLSISNAAAEREKTAVSSDGSEVNDEDDDDDLIGEEEMELELLQRELKAAESAQETLALFLCQEGKCSEATPLLKAKLFEMRLSEEVLCYVQNTASVINKERAIITSDIDGDEVSKVCVDNEIVNSRDYLRVTDNAISSSMIAHLQHVFRPISPFWKEHQYDVIANSSRTAGYFSYLYPLRERAACCSVEQVIDSLFEKVKMMFPSAAEECNYAEWWVHTRPHSSGHQLHFDSDDEGLTRGAEGRPVHPICSTVLYLDEIVGGPTLVTDQSLGGGLAHNGWLSFPKTNRLVLFDARFLHGVIPGRGVNPDPSRRRLTFMVGFWRDIKARQNEKDTAGPSQTFPDSFSAYTWHKEMFMQPRSSSIMKVPDKEIEVQPQLVSLVWESIYGQSKQEDEDIAKGAKSNEGSSSISTPAATALSYNKCFQGF